MTDSDPLLPLFPCGAKLIRSWPIHPLAGIRRISYHPLSYLLTARFGTDAFTSAYSVPDIPYRLAGDAPSELPTGVPMVVYLFDYDCVAAHKATGGDGDIHADDGWWERTLNRTEALFATHPGGYVYRTRGGARIVYLRESPLILGAVGDELLWRREYCQLLAHLARNFGIICDPGTHDWPRFMRLPHAVRDGKPLDLESVGNPHNVGPLHYAPTDDDMAANLDHLRALGIHDRRWRPIAVHLAGNDAQQLPAMPQRTRTVRTISSADLPNETLQRLARDLAAAMPSVGNHAAHNALAGACYACGIPTSMGRALGNAIAIAQGGQDGLDRGHVWETTAQHFIGGTPHTGWGTLIRDYPDLARILETALPSYGGARDRRVELDAIGILPSIPASGVATKLRSAIDRRDTGPSVISVTEGAGKTRVALAILQDRARAVRPDANAIPSRDKAVYAAPSHAVASDVAAGMTGLRAEYWRSPLAVRDANGTPLCKHHHAVSRMTAAGHPTAAWCESPCPDRNGCQAVAQAIQRLGPVDRAPVVVITVHAMAEQAIAWAGDSALVILDEDPQALTAIEITRAQLEAAAEAMDYFGRREIFRAPVLRALAAGLERGTLPHGEALREVFVRGCQALADDTAWEAAIAEYYGNPDPDYLLDTYATHAAFRNTGTHDAPVWERRAAWAPHPTKTQRDRVFVGVNDPILVAVSATHAAVARLVVGVIRTAPPGATCREKSAATVEPLHTDPSRRILRGVSTSYAIAVALHRHGPTVILDATANAAVLSVLAGGTVPATSIRVADGAPVTRELLYWSHASRRHVFRGDAIQWDDGLARYLAVAIRRAVAFAPRQPLAFFGWKTLIDGFREGKDPNIAPLLQIAAAAGCPVVLGHYGAARGRNDWATCATLVSVGDPHANLGASRAIASVLGLSAEHAAIYRHQTAAELSQVSGRLRTPWRSAPALHLHVGTILPLGWDAAATILEIPHGQTSLSASQTLSAVHVMGSQRFAASTLVVAAQTVSRNHPHCENTNSYAM